jgi:hypothetical protein
LFCLHESLLERGKVVVTFPVRFSWSRYALLFSIT